MDTPLQLFAISSGLLANEFLTCNYVTVATRCIFASARFLESHSDSRLCRRYVSLISGLPQLRMWNHFLISSRAISVQNWFGFSLCYNTLPRPYNNMVVFVYRWGIPRINSSSISVSRPINRQRFSKNKQDPVLAWGVLCASTAWLQSSCSWR